MKTKILACLTLVSLSLVSCKKGSVGMRSIAPFEIVNDTTISLNDDIDRHSLEAFNEAIRQNPGTTLLIFKEAPGSKDDEVNVQVGRKLHEIEMNTHVEDNGFIASGAVDLFLAGKKRSLGENTRVGVHSWSDGSREALDFPRDAEEHQLFIRYYLDIGLEKQLAEDFYFFTIEAAPAAEIHWMTPAEIATYQISNK